MFAIQLERWFDIFGRDNFKVTQTGGVFLYCLGKGPKGVHPLPFFLGGILPFSDGDVRMLCQIDSRSKY